MFEHGVEEATTDTLAVMRWGDADLVDPELRGLVGVHVVHGGDHPNDDTVGDGNVHVMTRVIEKLMLERRIDGAVEHAIGDAIEEAGVVRLEEAQFDGHAM